MAGLRQARGGRTGSRVTRRGLLARGAGAAAGLGLAASLARAAGANERIRIGCVGIGGRGTGLLHEVLALGSTHNVAVTALCDVWKVNLAAAAKRVQEASGQEPFTCTRFADLIARDDVDAVVIATPDFAHMPVLLAALKAGKDAYVEKPMSMTVEESAEALGLARDKQRIVQVGTQRRSEGGYKAAAKEYATGVLGQVSRITSTVNFNHPRWARNSDAVKEAELDWDAYLLHLPKRPFDPKLYMQWQLYREFTIGLPGLWMTHLADVVHMVTGAKFPRAATAMGGVFVWKDGRHTSDTFTALLEYPEGFVFDWSMNLACADQGITFRVQGTKGFMDVEKLTLGVVTKESKGKCETRRITAEPNESHMGNWLACLRTRELPNADIAYGHQHSVATILPALAMEAGKRLRYDAEKMVVVPDVS